MDFITTLTQAQVDGLNVELQIVNAQRRSPTGFVGGIPQFLPQLTKEEYVNALVVEIADRGVKKLNDAAEAKAFELYKASQAV